jgi:hypothetical protein
MIKAWDNIYYGKYKLIRRAKWVIIILTS